MYFLRCRSEISQKSYLENRAIKLKIRKTKNTHFDLILWIFDDFGILLRGATLKHFIKGL